MLDGCYLVMGGGDKIVWFWNISIGDLLVMFVGYINVVILVVVVYDGCYIVMGSVDKIVWFWDVVMG